MDWRQRLKSIVGDPVQKGEIIYQLLRESTEFRNELFVDDDDDVVRASLLALIKPAGGGMFSNFPMFYTILLVYAATWDACVSHPRFLVEVSLIQLM